MGVKVMVGVYVTVGVRLGVRVIVGVREDVGLGPGVGVPLGVGVFVLVGVEEAVGVSVAVGVGVSSSGVGVGCGVLVGGMTIASVGTRVGVGAGPKRAFNPQPASNNSASAARPVNLVQCCFPFRQKQGNGIHGKGFSPLAPNLGRENYSPNQKQRGLQIKKNPACFRRRVAFNASAMITFAWQTFG